MRRTVHPTTTSQEIPPAALPSKKWNPFLKLGLPQVAQIKMWFLKIYKENENIRSKRFRLVSEQKKTEERDFRFWQREKWNESQKMREGEGGGEGRKRLQTNPSILKTCVRQRTQRLIGSASQTILTCVDQRFVSYWEVMHGTWHASSCGCCLFWSARFTFQCKSIFFNFFWNAKLFLRIYKGFRSFNLFSKVAFGSK